jgi:hypothetical protein
MKATIEFVLPEESHEHKCAVFSGSTYTALSTIYDRIRMQLKHGDEKKLANDMAEELREIAWDALRLVDG